MKIPALFSPTGAVTTLPAAAYQMYKAAFAAAGAGLVAAGVPSSVVSFLASKQPGPTDVGTRLRVLNSAAGTFSDVAATDLRDINRLKPEIHNVFEGGYKGIIGRRLQVQVDLWHENRKNFVGPLIVETPNVFMDAASLGTYIGTQLAQLVAAGALTAAQAQALAPTIAGALGGVSGSTTAKGVPLGVVNFQEPLSAGADVILAYRNFGNMNVWGSDLGASLLLTDQFSVAGTYSYVNKNLFPRSEVGGVQDISLNAPANKHSVTLNYRDEGLGWGAELRERHVDAFEALAFISAHIKQYTLMDAGVNYRPPSMRNLLIAVNGTNLFNKRHQEFAQGGLIGRLIITRLQVSF
jgi:iron complex outermembrane receptor protein